MAAGEHRALQNVAAVVLAAGLSTRMTPHNKLLLRDSAGEAMVARVVDAALDSQACGVWVVVGHQADHVVAALGGRDVRLVHAPDYAAGLAHSLGAGITALPDEVAAALVCLADMPNVTAPLMNKIMRAYEPGLGQRIVVPVHRGQRGNPVLWDRGFFSDILQLTGDRGARELFARHAAHICNVEVVSEGVLRDVDTPGDIN